MRVFVTGLGIISAIGNDVHSNYDSLSQGMSGLDYAHFFDSQHRADYKVGEVKLSNEALFERLNISNTTNFTRTALLGLHAAKEACTDAGFETPDAYKTGLISANTVGGMDKTETHFLKFSSSPDSQKYISSHFASDSTQKIADALNITDFVTTISTACSSSANAIMLGARMIKSGQLDRAIVGGVDALSKFTFNGFKSLLLLTKSECRAFDAEREGLNLGEAAAFLVLESEELVKRNAQKVHAEISGYGNANDAFHQTASSSDGEGAYLAMMEALRSSSLQASDIDYINAHGTATPNNDASESVALHRIFGDKLPPFSSTKAFTGHTLAAAGAVEAVFSIMALKKSRIFPNLNFETPIEKTGLRPETVLKQKNLLHVLSNSFGFGGNCSALIFSQP